MPEKETPPMHPDLAAALRAYEVEMRDGTERSQKYAFEALRLVRRRLGEAAVFASTEESEDGSPKEGDHTEQVVLG